MNVFLIDRPYLQKVIALSQSIKFQMTMLANQQLQKRPELLSATPIRVCLCIRKMFTQLSISPLKESDTLLVVSHMAQVSSDLRLNFDLCKNTCIVDPDKKID